MSQASRGSWPGGVDGILTLEEYGQFRLLVESQKPRALKRYLDYEKRLRAGLGLDELRRWLAKILADDGQVYGLEDKAMAFEICAREAIASLWPVEDTPPACLAVAGPVDRVFLYRQLLAPTNGSPRRAAFLGLLRRDYRRSWTWLRERLDHPPDGSVVDPAFAQLLEHFDEIDPLDLGASGGAQVAALEAELARRAADMVRLREYLQASRDRAEAAHSRSCELEEEVRGLRRLRGEEEEAQDKLRAERTRRIKAERETVDAGGKLEQLKSEYVKLDQRLRQMAGRLAAADRGRRPFHLSLEDLRNLEPREVLGVDEGVGEEELGRIRRRFAAAFHSDRAGHLPGWVGDLFDQVLGAVNSACDRLSR